MIRNKPDITLHISKGNIKTGSIPSFSLPSGKTCSRDACRTCLVQGCYAAKLERLRPNVKRSYEDNYQRCLTDLEGVERELNSYFSRMTAPLYFRIHVSGDFYSADYVEMWLRVIRKHPRTRFLAFTKQYDIIAPYLSKLPKNLSLVASGWPGVDIPMSIASCLPIAWMQDGTETRIPIDSEHCSGGCDTCGLCWNLKNRNVYFNKH